MSDLISRQAAIEEWKEDFKGFVNSLDVPRDDYRGIMEYIDELPYADRPQGEWIDKGDYAECSICGANSGTQFNGVEPVPRKTKFCPNCGADMRGKDDE